MYDYASHIIFFYCNNFYIYQIKNHSKLICIKKIGVDINRNWDAHWEFSTLVETNSGDEPFSEVET